MRWLHHHPFTQNMHMIMVVSNIDNDSLHKTDLPPHLLHNYPSMLDDNDSSSHDGDDNSSCSSTRRRPLLSEPKTLTEFLEHLYGQQNSTSSLKSCFAGGSSGNKDKDRKQQKTKDKKQVRYCTNQENGKVWCLVKVFAKVKRKYKDALWWDKQTLLNRGATDVEMAHLVEDRFFTILQQGYQSIQGKGRTYDIPKNLVEQVSLDTEGLEECSGARGLEALVDPAIHQSVKKHCKAVLTAQDLLYEQGHDLHSERACRLIAEASAKYSHASRVFVKKMALFDQEQAQEYYREECSVVEEASSKKKQPPPQGSSRWSNSGSEDKVQTMSSARKAPNQTMSSRGSRKASPAVIPPENRDELDMTKVSQ